MDTRRTTWGRKWGLNSISSMHSLNVREKFTSVMQAMEYLIFKEEMCLI